MSASSRHLVAEVDLLNRHTKAFDAAALFDQISEANLADFEHKWRPQIEARLAVLSSDAEIQAANIQDWHWNWREKAQRREGSLASDSFAIEADGMTQGLMFTKSTAFGRLDEQKGADLIYVEYLATAPWNRVGFTDTPLYKGVGRILVATAISLSHELGFNGRIALHSVPQSEAWYRDACGMTDLGPDLEADDRGILCYFEMTAAQAASFTSS
jgi:hypothetical protein